MMYKEYNHQKYIDSHKYVNRESIFTIGQWVILKDRTAYGATPRLVTTTFLGNGKYPQQLELSPTVSCLAYSLDYELWVPTYNEWCWFWGSSSPILAQCGGKLDNRQFYTVDDKYFSNCEPFLGNLPTFHK